MKTKYAAILIASIPWLVGCMTGLTIEKASERKRVEISDSVEKIEQARLIDETTIQVFTTVRLTNSPHLQACVITAKLNSGYTNSFKSQKTEETVNYRHIYLGRRSVVLSPTNSISEIGAELKIGPPFLLSHTNSPLMSFVNRVANPEVNTIYQIQRENPDGKRTDSIEFIYVAAKKPDNLILIKVANKAVDSPSNKAYLLLLPLAIPADIVTLPIQIPLYIAVAYSMGK